MGTKRISEFASASNLTGFEILGNQSGVTKKAPADLIAGQFLPAADSVNPMDLRFGAIGNMTADDTAAIQAAVTYLEGIGGGELVFTRPHKITTGIVSNANVAITVRFSGRGKLYCVFSTAQTALAFNRTWDAYVTPPPCIYNARIVLATGSTSAVSTGIYINYPDTTGGSTAGPTIEGGYITGETGSTYFLYGIRTEGAAHAKISRVSINGRGGLASTRFGAGIRIGNWGQGTRIMACSIRGFSAGIYDTDIDAVDPTSFQAEGLFILNCNFQVCDRGVYVDLQDTEISWSVQHCQFSCNIGIETKNLAGLQVQNNTFQWSNKAKDLVDILISRFDATAPTDYLAQGVRTQISGNRTQAGGNINFDVTAVATGATTVLTYTNTSTSRTISSIAVDGNGYVTVTYVGADTDLSNGAIVTISGVVDPTEANADFRMGDLDKAANTFRLYDPDDSLSSLNLIDGSTWAAYTSGGEFVRVFGTGSLANGDVMYVDQVTGPDDLNRRPVIVASHDSGAKTFRILDYYTGLDIDSTAWAAFSDTARLTRYGRFLEVKGGKDIEASDNFVQSRNVGVHLWAATRNVQIVDNMQATSGSYASNTVLNDSSYPDTITVFSATEPEADEVRISNITHFTRTVGSPGDGVRNDAPWWRDILANGKSVILGDASRKRYLLKSKVDILYSGTGIICPSGVAYISMDTSAGAFDNPTYANRYDSDAVAIEALGTSGTPIEDVRLENFRLKPSSWVDDRYLKGVHLKYVKNFHISGLDISNFSRGRGLVTLNNVTSGIIEKNYFHDCWSNSVTGTAQNAQITAIETDFDADSQVDPNGERYSSRGVIIRANRIMRMTLGSAAIAAFGYQTDGINLCGESHTTAASSKPTRDFLITGNRFGDVGEGVGCTGEGNEIIANHFRRCFTQAVRLIHGASNNSVHGNMVMDSGLAGIVLGASNTANKPAADNNSVKGNIIRSVNAKIDWYNADGTKSFDSVGATVAPAGAGNAYGIRITVLNPAVSQVQKSVIAENDIDCNSGINTIGISVQNAATGSATQVAIKNAIRNCASSLISDPLGYLSTLEHTPQSGPVTVTGATYTVLDTDCSIIANRAGTVTLTLPVGRTGAMLFIKTVQAQAVDSASSNVVPVTGGAASTTICAAVAGRWTILMWNGSNWEKIASG